MPTRLAVVDAEFHLTAGMRAFDSADIRGLTGYEPEAMALPLDAALSLADRKLRGLLDLPGLKLAIVVLSSVDLSGAGPLASHHRDLLWQAFGLPVFEQLRAWNGRVIARECEVHDGLHFDANAALAESDRGELFVAGLPTGFAAEIVMAHCDCGLETPRLRHRMFSKARAAAA